jgi:transcriptional regulator with XRE-family HTH domain
VFCIQKSLTGRNGDTRRPLRPRLEEVLAKRLRDIARDRKMPISHVADRAGLAHSYFWQLLRAEASPTLAVVQRLAEALDVEPLALLRAGAIPYALPAPQPPTLDATVAETRKRRSKKEPKRGTRPRDGLKAKK